MEARCLSKEIFLWKQRGDAKPVTAQRRLGPRLENTLENARAEAWGTDVRHHAVPALAESTQARPTTHVRANGPRSRSGGLVRRGWGVD